MTIRSLLMRSALFLLIIILIVGGIGLYYANDIGKSGEEVGARLAPLGDAAMEIKLTATEAHLIFEEILGGDDAEDIQAVWDLLDQTLFYCDAILEGRTNDEGTFVATKDLSVAEKIKVVKRNVEVFTDMAKARYAQRSGATGTGSGADQEFDEIYEKIQSEILTVLKEPDSVAVALAYALAKYELANGHLFLEEFLGGDESVNIDEVRKEFKAAKSKISSSQIGKDVDVLIAAMEERVETSKKNQTASSDADVKFDAAFAAFIQNADDAEELIHESMDKGLKSLHTKMMMGVITILVVTLVVALGFFFVISRFSKKTNKSIDLILDALKAIVRKEYTETLVVKTNVNEVSQIAKAVDMMGNELQKNMVTIGTQMEDMSALIENVTEVAEKVYSNSEQLANSSNALSDGATQQAASLEEITATVAQIEEMSKDNAIQSQKGDSLAQTVTDSINASSKKMRTLKDAMNRIEESNSKITKINSVINDIAFQTNLLALNAAVEAARAGQQGKGFAVVADEVRSLANRSAKAAKEASILIDLAVNEVKEGMQLAEETATSLEDGVEGIVETSETLAAISQASIQQSTSIEEVMRALNSIEEITQSNAAHSEENAATSQELQGITSSLVDLVTKGKRSVETDEYDDEQYEETVYDRESIPQTY